MTITIPSRIKARQLAAPALAALLAACSTIPSSGPTGGELRSQIEENSLVMPIALIEVKTAADLPVSAKPAPYVDADYAPPPPTERVGPGDVLSITIYETGVALFGGTGRAPGGGAEGPAAFDPAARAERLPATLVNDAGAINVPYVGEMQVAGRTTNEIEVMIRRALRGKSQNPQVLVSITQGLTNSVIIGGDVRQPGRLVLPTNRESLSDVVALAGGSTGEIKDIAVRLNRAGNSREFRLSDVLGGSGQDLRIFPGDRILLVRAPRSFTVLGAAGRSDQLVFPAPRVSLIEAVGMAGGANPNAGDPRAVFVFRNVTGPEGEDVPTVFHFNMMQASSYLLAQRFEMTDKDVLYIGNAEANQPTKLVQIISQLFFPLITLQGVVNPPN